MKRRIFFRGERDSLDKPACLVVTGPPTLTIGDVTEVHTACVLVGRVHRETIGLLQRLRQFRQQFVKLIKLFPIEGTIANITYDSLTLAQKLATVFQFV